MTRLASLTAALLLTSACSAVSDDASAGDEPHYEAFTNQTLSISRTNGREDRSLDVGLVSSRQRNLKISAHGDGTIHFWMNDGEQMGMGIASAVQLCHWADSTRNWLKTPIKGPAGATIDEASTLSEGTIGYQFEVGRSGLKDSARYSLTLLTTDAVKNSFIGGTYRDVRRAMLDSLLQGFCAATDSAVAIAGR